MPGKSFVLALQKNGKDEMNLHLKLYFWLLAGTQMLSFLTCSLPVTIFYSCKHGLAGLSTMSHHDKFIKMQISGYHSSLYSQHL